MLEATNVVMGHCSVIVSLSLYKVSGLVQNSINIICVCYHVLVSLSVSITASGTNTAGETYSLVCSVTVTGSTDQPTITWLDNGAQITSDASRTVSATTGDGSNGYYSTMTFNPLSVAHARTYTCRAIVGGEMNGDIEVVSVQSEFCLE